MPYPTPENGLVISYSYLWQNEYKVGKLEGLKKQTLCHDTGARK